jgi:NADH-quinone oxidoreductase subunit F
MAKVTYIEGKEPHELETRLIFRNIDRKNYDTSIATYFKDGGYEELKKAVTMAPADVTAEVKTAGLRGRGGAGFPTGVKWGFIPPTNTKPVYLICNADESEPGTFKDRYIMHQDPHQLIEGMAISCYAVGAKLAYIYIREEFPEAALILEKAIEEAQASISKSTSTAEPVLTFAEKRPASSSRSKASAPTRESSPLISRQPWASICARPSSTTSSPSAT